MIILFIILQTTNGSLQQSQKTEKDWSNFFQGCTYSGQNKFQILFQCAEQNFLVPKLELTSNQMEVIALEGTKKSFLSNYILCDLIQSNGINTLEIREIIPGFKQRVVHHEQNIQFFEITQIDSMTNIIVMVSIKSVYEYTLQLNSFLLGNLNKKLIQYTCDHECYFIDMKQFYNKVRNTLVIIILQNNLLKILEYQLIQQKLVEVQIMNIDQNANPINLILDTYLIIKFEQFQILYTIGTLFYEIKEITRFDSQPLQFLKNVNGINKNYILQQNNQTINIISIIETHNWQNPIKIITNKIDIKYTELVFNMDSNQLLFIYDKFDRILTDYNLLEQSIEDCSVDGYEIPQMNLQSLKYQETLLQNTQTVSLYNYNKQECDFPCDEIYHSLNIPMIPYKQECMIQQLYDHLIYGCNVFDQCFSCMRQLGCSWNNGYCSSQSYDEEINLQTPQQSSKFYLNKVLQCGKEMQFNESIQGHINEGMVYSWFYDAQQMQQFRLSIQADFGEIKNNIFLQSICLGQDYDELCKPLTINQFKSEYIYKSIYFRFTIVILEDLNIKNFDLILQQETINEQQTKTLVFLIFWVTCVLVLFAIIVYIANKRMQFLLSLTIQNNSIALDQSSLDQLLNTMIDQNVIKKHQYSSQLIMYDEEKCPFCIEKFEIQQNLIQIFCGHSFHQNCFEDWVRINTKLIRCPICNQTIENFLKNKELYCKT